MSFPKAAARVIDIACFIILLGMVTGSNVWYFIVFALGFAGVGIVFSYVRYGQRRK